MVNDKNRFKRSDSFLFWQNGRKPQLACFGYDIFLNKCQPSVYMHTKLLIICFCAVFYKITTKNLVIITITFQLRPFKTGYFYPILCLFGFILSLCRKIAPFKRSKFFQHGQLKKLPKNVENGAFLSLYGLKTACFNSYDY